jgi:hypothetical protein
MKIFTTAAAALAMTAMMTAGPTNEAKADGGAVAIGVGAYLLVDALVGRRCERHDWPFNIPAKIVDELHGKPACHRRDYRQYRRHHRGYK